MKDNARYVNREISWLRFNERVLQEAADSRVPLIERLRFLGIFSNNLDEFFKVRYASVRRLAQLNAPHRYSSFDPIPADALLREINREVRQLQSQYAAIYDELLEKLAEKDIFLLDERQVKPEQRAFLKRFFNDQVAPVLNLLTFDKRLPFPELRDSSLYLIVTLHREGKQPHYALIEVPTDLLSRFVVLPAQGQDQYLILLEDIIRFHLEALFSIFPHREIQAHAFKISRDAELSIDNGLRRSFVDKVARSLEKRKRGKPVRFVYDAQMPNNTLRFLLRQLNIATEVDSVIPGGRYHNKRDFMSFPNLGGPSCEYPQLEPLSIPDFSDARSMFEIIAQRDYLIQTPYQDFDHVIHWLREASIDPRVKKIQLTIYRVADDSRVLAALINAARNGKAVSVNIELRARFDEAANLQWAEALREAGIQVLFGLPGLKVHAKLCYIERQGTPRRFALIGTGNFNESTARCYTDYFLFTADKRLTREVKRVFQFFHTSYKPLRYDTLIVSPLYARDTLYQLIDREIKNHKRGLPAFINLRLNNLVDKSLIDKLYQASKAGVPMRFIIRGICCLRPGVPGLSDSIQAISIVDQFLEHARVYWFANAGEDRVYIASADWMKRNLDFRVEVGCPIRDPILKREITDVFECYWRDHTKARILDPDQTNRYEQAERHAHRAQFDTYAYYRGKTKSSSS